MGVIVNKYNEIKRFTTIAVTLLYVLSFLLISGLISPKVFALCTYASGNPCQVQSRSITLSSSTPSATGVTYTVAFIEQDAITHPDVMIDFCSNDPLVSDSCTATLGTDVPNFTSATPPTNWSGSKVGGSGGTYRGIVLTTTTQSFTAGQSVSLAITGVTNPSTGGTNGSFYSRILVYTNGGAGTNTSASPGTYEDYGGIALAVTNNINITSKVYETLTFCVYKGGSCANAPTGLVLGNSTTGALSVSNAYIMVDAQYELSTNAGSGVNVSMFGTTLCRTTGSNCQPGANYAANTIAAMTSNTTSVPGSAQFGMCDNIGSGSVTVDAQYLDGSATPDNCNTNLTADGTYAGTGNSTFGFNDSASSGGTNSTGGSRVMYSSGAVNLFTGNFVFLGNISNNVVAGIYTTALNLVATGTF